MTAQNVPPLVYSQLRMLAEAALGLRAGEDATFVFDLPGTDESPSTNILGPQIVPQGAPIPPQGVVVPTSNPGNKFPDPGQVLVRVDGAEGPGVNAVEYHADALFWSNAAVQKFVLPYYTSCMGYQAYDQLTVLQQAWNGIHHGVQVFALMHVTGAPVGQPGALKPMEPIWVVFLHEETGTVKTLPLSVFSRRHPGTVPPLERPAPRPYVAPEPGTGTPYPDYTALRSMAEWAASLHTEPMYFTYDPEQRQFGPPRPRMDPDGTAIVVPAFNPYVHGKRVQNVHVVFGDLDLAADCDAVFWSTGAIEQFLLPYYASIDGFGGLRDLQALRESWMENRAMVGGNLLHDGKEVQYQEDDGGDRVIGIFHIWPSMEESITETETQTTALRLQTGLLVHAGPSGGVTRRSHFNARAGEAAGAA